MLAPTNGAYLGTFSATRPGETRKAAILRVESTIGRTFAVDHAYYRWDDAFPTSYEAWTWSRGRIPLISWNAARDDGTPVPWSAIADGTQDGWIRARAQAVKAFDHPMYLSFHHEPEDDEPSFGSETDFVNAFRHIVTIFRTQGVTNVAYVWTLMGWTFTEGTAGRWYPGNAYVDFVASDSYNWYPGRRTAKWRSFQWVMQPTVTFADARGKPVIVAEYGVQEDPATPGRKAQWFRDALTTPRSWPQVKVVSYFDSPKIYPWWTDSTSSSTTAYRDVAGSAWLNP